MAAGTALSRLTGFLKLMVLAACLGAGRLADAYNLANTTPNMVYELVAGGILAATVIPVFVDRIGPNNSVENWNDVSAVITLGAVLLVIATVAFEFLAPSIIHLYSLGVSNSPKEIIEERVATELLRFFAPQVIFYGIVTLATALLNARRRFGPPAYAPAVNNLIVMAILGATVAMYGQPDLASAAHNAAMIALLGVGTTAGVALQFLTLLPSLRSAGVKIKWKWEPANPAVISMLRLSGWTLGFVFANQATLFVILTLTHAIEGDGGVSAWTYAYTFFQLPYGVIAVSVMSVSEPALASAWSQHRLGQFRGRLTSGLSSMLALVLPASVGLALLAKPIVRAVLYHGAALRTGTADTGGLLITLACGLPGFCTYLFLGRAWQAMKDTRSLFFLYVIENGLNVILAFLLSPFLGLAGIGWSFSAAYTGAAVVSFIWLADRGVSADLYRVGRAVLRVLPATAGMAFLAFWLYYHLPLGPTIRVAVAVAAGVASFSAIAGLHAILHNWRRHGSADSHSN